MGFSGIFVPKLSLLSLNKRSYISYIWILTTSFHDYRFFTVSELHQGQDAAMLKSAIVNAFTENNMEDALTKIVFFGSDGTWTNSGLKSGLITRLKEDFEWIVFVWCLSHRLELAMKDSLKTFVTSWRFLKAPVLYVIKNSSKKLSQLKTLFKSLTEIYEYETKANQTRKIYGHTMVRS